MHSGIRTRVESIKAVGSAYGPLKPNAEHKVSALFVVNFCNYDVISRSSTFILTQFVVKNDSYFPTLMLKAY